MPFWNKKKAHAADKGPKQKGAYTPAQVADYYDKVTDKYLEIYGEVIQALRPSNTAELLDYTMERAGFKPGMRILDAGCGVGGPAIHFASKMDLKIEGGTISPVQVEKAQKRIAETGLTEKVSVLLADYHHLEDHFENGSFDMVLFLESLGHAQDPEKVIRSARKVLKGDGYVYIKDFFTREVGDPEQAKRNARVVQLMNEGYNYNVLDLHQTISSLRIAGFHIVSIQRPEIENDVAIRTAFETDQGIDLWGWAG